ncbi:glucan synthase protein [Diplodia corticola]|uniref:Glucan synthase protein n=1 Tax=Diplodia corticola TaxID=236234 RepID=A0A1J9R210_9PEZI|nr:glucan synthase protein [Diplodia corticola]OJD34672.1 glucan synthase protein [Diplodia corticola]
MPRAKGVPTPRRKAEVPTPKRKAEFQEREYSKRPRRTPVSYADPENSDDSAFYETDEDGEGVTARKAQRPKPSRPLPKHKIFPFLSLPRELRDLIYDYALGCPTIVTTTISPVNHDPNADPEQSTTTTTTAFSNIIRLQEVTVGFRKSTRRMGHFSQSLLRTGDDGATTTTSSTTNTVASWPALNNANNNAANNDNGDRPTLVRRRTYAPAPLALGLLGVSRQVHSEAARVLYGGRTRLQFGDSMALQAFVARLSRGTRALVRDVRLMRWQHARSACRAFDRTVFELLAEGVTGLAALRVPKRRYSSLDGKWEARRVCRHGWRWLEAMAGEREDGFEGVLNVLLAGVDDWGDGWRAGEEKREMYVKEFKALMKVQAE